jgi:hypothetical protein
LFGKIVVTVEVGGYAMWAYSRNVTWGTEFRDATALDMVTLELIKLDPSRAAKPDQSTEPPAPRR